MHGIGEGFPMRRRGQRIPIRTAFAEVWGLDLRAVVLHYSTDGWLMTKIQTVWPRALASPIEGDTCVGFPPGAVAAAPPHGQP